MRMPNCNDRDKTFGDAVGSRFVMGLSAQGDNVEARGAVAVFYRYGEMIQAANMQRCVGVDVFVAHGISSV